MDDWPQGSPVLFEDKVIIASRSGILYGVDVEEGSISWRMDLGEGLRHSPVVDPNGVAVIGTVEGRLLAIDLQKQALIWEQGVEGGIFGQVAVTEHGIIATTLDGFVILLH